MTVPIRTITSTSGLTPAGVFGYAKTIAAFLTAVLVVVADYLPENWQKPVQGVIAVLGVIAVYALPNAVQATAVYDEPGKHAAE